MPPGSLIVMTQKSAYVTAKIFLNWCAKHFPPGKGEGKALLILDEHSSHCSCVDLLETAEAANVILLCLPIIYNRSIEPSLSH